MIAAKLTITSPQDSTSEVTVATSYLKIDAQMDYPSTLTAVFDVDWETYQNEDDSDSPIQMRAYVEYRENSVYKFRGRIHTIERMIVGGVPQITITALDMLEELNEVMAVYMPSSTPYYVWSRETPALAISNQTLKAGYAYEGYRHVWYPEFPVFATDATANSGPWLSRAVSSTTTLGANITDVATEIKAGTSNAGFPPSGFASIQNDAGTNHEWFQYNGYTYNQSDGYWYFNNCVRGRLGSTAVAHTAPQTIYSRISKRIHYSQAPRIQGNTGTVWETIPDSKYKINMEDGSISFSQDPLTMRGTTDASGTVYTAIRMTYSVYDEEDGTNQLKLSEVLSDLFGVEVDYLGPSTHLPANPTLDASLTPDPIISRLVVDKPMLLGEFLRNLLSEMITSKSGTPQDAIGMWYDPETNKWCIKTLAQSASAATADRTYDSEQGRYEEVSIDEVYSAVVVRYTTSDDFNLLAQKRMWHPKSYDASWPRMYQINEGDFARHESTTLIHGGYHASNLGLRLTEGSGGYRNAGQDNKYMWLDNNAVTGAGLMWNSSPSAQVVLYAWFPGTLAGGSESATAPDLFYIDTVTIALRLVGTSAAYPDNLRGTVYAYETFTGATSANDTLAGAGGSAGTPKEISSQLRFEHTPGNLNQTGFTRTVNGLNVPARAIGIQLDEALEITEMAGGTVYGLMILDIYVSGTQYREAIVKLTDAYSTGSPDVVAPNSYDKLVDASIGNHRTLVIDVGPATREVALNLGWLQLLTSLALSQARTYTIESVGMDSGGGAPVLGETLAFSDGFYGICDSYSYEVVGQDGGRRTLTMRCVNYNTTLFGAGV